MLSLSSRVCAGPRAVRTIVCLLAVFATTGVRTSVRAAEPDTADVLFREGRRLLDSGKLEEACVKLAESQRLEASIGTLLNLGDCHERQGKLATAWSTFLAAARLAGDRDDGARSVEGLRRAVLLEPKLSYLVIRVDPAARGAVIRDNGSVIETEKLGGWLPVDPGEHIITAEATGHATFHKSVRVERWGAIKIEVPALALAAGLRQMEVTKQAPPEGGRSALPYSRVVGGDTAAGVGLAALTVGSIFFVNANDSHSKVREMCPGNQCNANLQAALALRERGDSQALVSKISFGLGAASLITSAGLFFWPTSKEKPRSATARVGVTIAPMPGGAVVSGLF